MKFTKTSYNINQQLTAKKLCETNFSDNYCTKICKNLKKVDFLGKYEVKIDWWNTYQSTQHKHLKLKYFIGQKQCKSWASYVPLIFGHLKGGWMSESI